VITDHPGHRRVNCVKLKRMADLQRSQAAALPNTLAAQLAWPRIVISRISYPIRWAEGPHGRKSKPRCDVNIATRLVFLWASGLSAQ
jgi:hypothetical protein